MNSRFKKASSAFALTLLATASLAGCGAPSNQATTSGTGNQTSNAVQNTTNQGSTPPTTNNTPVTTLHWSSPPPMQINVSKQYDAIVHTNYGNFEIQLFAKATPHTVNNFVFLAKHNFFNGDKFFRIIKTFMIQTGDPNNNGTGGPGYQFADELPPKYPYAQGIVAMANAGPNTNGSQFFVCTGPDAASLNQTPNYTEFGKVIQGMNVVEKIASIPVTTNPSTGEQSLPTKDAYIKSVTIVEK